MSPLLSLEVVAAEKKTLVRNRSSDMQVSAQAAKRPASKVVLSRMLLTLHATRRTPHGTSRLVHAISAWSVKTQRAPSWHRRDARVYGIKTTVTHGMRTAPNNRLKE